MQYGLLIPVDGTAPHEIKPANGQHFIYEELSEAVGEGGMIEPYDIGENEEFTLYLNEEGKMYELPDNALATTILAHWTKGSIFEVTGERVVGPVLIVGPVLYRHPS